jgi:hypothetical protein
MVKSHTRELYRKLGVTSQAEAVTRGEALGLLEPINPPGDLGPGRPKRRPPAVMLATRCRQRDTA